jgi:hypothetical protein
VLKRTIILSILGAFMFQAVVYNGCLYAFTLLAKFEEKTVNAQWITFSEQQYSKLKLNDTEFSYNNNLYDIISSKTENGTISLLCKVDGKEKDFLEKLIEGFKQSKTKKYIAFTFVADTIKSFEFLIGINDANTIKHLCFSSSIQEKILERTIPPPKV